ncbi:Sodium/hydrogen exchanger family-domain-containing protein [Gigaspora rosea]|uniref:Sodium/hydrogen exchanger family-domain-containing protein n=1 Tax=Gigaspora rosea TaxID=44941 RepID=A0A397UZ57_9GLOM|nr:Sodium/hydrogen exchanger family-domain-containing protein [Gigaspora rosea]
MFVKEKLYLSESLVCVAVGIAIGPIGLNIVAPEKWGENIDVITREFTRFVIAIQVMACGVALPKAYLWTQLKSMLLLLIPVMSWMWMISALSIWWLLPNLSFLESLMIASCIAPTDPVLSNTMIKGRFAQQYISVDLRDLISGESAANDGLGFPFLYIAIYLSKMSPGEAFGKWLLVVVCYQVILSILIGFAIGYIARKSLHWAVDKKLIDKEMFLTFAVVLALFIMGSVSILGSDELLACFIAGNSFTWDDWYREETQVTHFQEIIDILLNLTVFIYIGAIVPWSSFNNGELGLSYWRLFIVSILILLFRRLPIVLMLMKNIPPLKNFREGLYAGWFGPIGIGAIFYADLAKRDGTENVQKIVNPVVFFIVLSSVFCHGISIPVIKIGKRVNSLSRTATTQSVSQLATTIVIRDKKKRDPGQTTAETDDIFQSENSSVDEINMANGMSNDKTNGETGNMSDKNEINNADEIITIKEVTNEKVDDIVEKDPYAGLESENINEECENISIEKDGSCHVYVTPNPP